MQEGRAREQFAQYVNAIFGDAAPAAPEPAPPEPAPPAGYPILHDAGEPFVGPLPDSRPARDQFTEWMGGQMQFDPFRDPDGWRRFL